MKCDKLEPKEFTDGVTKYYFQSEVDEAIAKLNKQVEFLKTTHSSCNDCNKCADGMGRVFDESLDELKKEKAYLLEHTTEVINSQERVIHRQKYKRCLAMAFCCESLIRKAFLANPEYVEWLYKWREKWLKISEKIKEAK